MKKKAIVLLGAASLLALTACSADVPLSQQEYDQAFTQRLKEHAYSQCSLTGEHEGLEVCSDQQKKNAYTISDNSATVDLNSLTVIEDKGWDDTKRGERISFNDVDHSHNTFDPTISSWGEEVTGGRVYARLEPRKGLRVNTGRFFKTKENVDFYHMVRDSIYYVYLSDADLDSSRTLDDPTGYKSRTQSRLSKEILDYTAQNLIVEARAFVEVDGEIFKVDSYGNLEYYAHQNWEDVEHQLSVDGYFPFGTFDKLDSEQ